MQYLMMGQMAALMAILIVETFHYEVGSRRFRPGDGRNARN